MIVAFLPAALIGALLHGFIKSVLFNPVIVCCTLIAGGLILLVVALFAGKAVAENPSLAPMFTLTGTRLRTLPLRLSEGRAS